MNSTQHQLANKPVFKLLLSFAGPAIIGLLLNALYNVVDRIFVGQFVGSDGLAALTFAFPLMIMQFGFTIMLGSGAATLISRYLGEGRQDLSEKVLGTMFACLIGIAILFMIVGLFFTKPLVAALGAEGRLLELSANYLRIIFLGTPFSMAVVMEFTIRGEGQPKFPALVITVASFTNMILDPILIKVLNLGVSGAALATIIAQSVSAFLYLFRYLSGRTIVKLHLKNIKFKKSYAIPIITVGFAPFIMDVASSIQNMVANKFLIRYGGEYGVAAMGIVFSINIICLMAAFGIGDGMMPIVSFNRGAKRADRAYKTLIYAVFLIEAVAITGLIVVELLPGVISNFFVRDNSELSNVAVTALRIFALSIPFFSFQIVGTRYFQAIHEKRLATISAILRQLIIFIPAIYFLGKVFGLSGIWLSFPISDFFAAAITFIFIMRFHANDKFTPAMFRNSN